MGPRGGRRRRRDGGSGLAALLVLTLVVAACGTPADPSPDGPAAHGPVTTAGAAPSGTRPASGATVSAPTTTRTGAPTVTVTAPAACLARAPLPALAARTVTALADPAALGPVVEAIGAGDLGGVVVIGDPDATIADVLAPLGDAAPTPVVAVDEEGGVVQRLEAVLGRLPSARRLADGGDPDDTRRRAREMAERIAGLGFTMVLAPVADIGTSAGYRSRTFGDDPATVTEQARAFAAGLADGGVVPVVKHFPGHGATPLDSHRSLAVTGPLDELRGRDLVPFAELADEVPAIMVGHLAVPGLTDGLPATVSAAAIDLLRDDLGFTGVVVSDDLTMGALAGWTETDAAVAALAAGVDLVVTGSLDAALDAATAVVVAVVAGDLTRGRVEQAVGRILDLYGDDPCAVW